MIDELGTRYIGLLTSEQKQAGYFVTQDEDFIWIWYRKEGSPDCIGVFLYQDAKIREVRELAQAH